MQQHIRVSASTVKIVRNKVHPEMPMKDFLTHCKTAEGEREVKHFRPKVVQIKQDRGKNCRISGSEWAKIPQPQTVTSEKETETAVCAPDELFFTPQEFMDKFQRTPEAAGLTCEMFELEGTNKWGCWVREDGPSVSPSRHNSCDWRLGVPCQVFRMVCKSYHLFLFGLQFATLFLLCAMCAWKVAKGLPRTAPSDGSARPLTV